MQLGVKEQLGVEPRIMQANGHGRSRTVTAEDVQRTVSSDQTQHTVSDEAVEEMSKQPHRQRFFPKHNGRRIWPHLSAQATNQLRTRQSPRSTK